MSEEEIFEKLKKIVVEELGADESAVRMDATFEEDLEADSLDLVELVMEIEEEFDIKIPDEDAESLTTVENLVQYIKSKKEE